MAMIPEFAIDRRGQEILQNWKEIEHGHQKVTLRALRDGGTTGVPAIDTLARDYAKTIYISRGRFIAYEEVLLVGFAASVLLFLWIIGVLDVIAIVIVTVVALILPSIALFAWSQSFKPIADGHDNGGEER